LLAALGGLPAAQAVPPVDPLPAPDYSFDASSPSVLDGFVSARDVLNVGFPYALSVLSGAALDLQSSLDDLDALSAGNAALLVDDLFVLLFSVTRESVGLAAPAPELVAAGVPYNMLDQAGRRHAAGDVFCTTELFTLLGNANAPDGGVRRNNFLVRNNFDEGGVDQAAYPPTSAQTMVPEGVPQDRVNALAQLSRLDTDGTIARLYFSLTATSPSLTTLPGGSAPSGANVFYAMHPAAMLGACCRASGVCELLAPDDCINTGGVWLGYGAGCELCQPPPPAEGACCLSDSSCAILGFDTCLQAGGNWLGPGTTCSLCPAGTGACCLMEGDCALVTELECNDLHGRWLAPGTTCDMCQMPPHHGACCLPGGQCQITSSQHCTYLGGNWLGLGTTCEQCDGFSQTGACCFAEGACAVVTVLACANAGGTPLGPQSTCAQCAAAPTYGACCRADGSCFESAGAECYEAGGVFHYHQVCRGDANANSIDDACENPPSRYVVTVYANHDELGLVAEDELDALIVIDSNENGVFDGADRVLFSLAPDSPSLETIAGASAQGAAADVFVAIPGLPPALFAAAADLGLGAAADDIDALDLYGIGQPRGSLAAQHGIRAPRGDLNCDGIVSFDDISQFALALAAPDAYQAANPHCDHLNGDCDYDGDVDFDDINGFVALLSEGG
jgi:hypothetical protein